MSVRLRLNPVTGNFDLVSAEPDLSAYVPYTGATANVDLGAFTLSAATPVTNENVATKAYVDEAITNLDLLYLLTNTASGVSTYKVADFNLAGIEASVSAASVTDTQIIQSWIASALDSPSTIPVGLLEARISAERTAGTKALAVYAEFYEYKTDTSEVLIATTANSIAVTARASKLVVASLLSQYAMSAGSRLLVKYRARVTGSGSDPSITLYYDGNTAANFGIPVTVAVLANNFLKLDGSNANQNVDLGAFDITANNLSGTNTGDQTSIVGISGTMSEFNTAVTDGNILFNDEQGLGFRFENRTSDPGTPTVGQVWLRTDL